MYTLDSSMKMESIIKMLTMLLRSSTTIFYLLPMLIILLLLLLRKWYSSVVKDLQPPSPPKLPVIGNLHQLGSSPHRSLQALAKKHGSLMLIHLGSAPVIVASSADAAQQIMKTHDSIFSNRVMSRTIPRKLFYDCKDIAFAPYGGFWRQVKSFAVLHLLSLKRVHLFRHVREEETALMVEKITNSSSSSSSSSSLSPVNLTDLFTCLTNDVICRAAFGRTYGFMSEFKKHLKQLLEFVGVFRVGDYIPWLSWLDSFDGLNARAEIVAKGFDEFFEGVIEEHLDRNRKDQASRDDAGKDERECQDLVDILLEIQRENTMGLPIDRETIKAVILDNFIGGTDTTATALEWVMAELLRHPKVMKKLQEEVRETGPFKAKITEDDLVKLHYLKAVVKEGLRLHAPLPLLIPRESMKEAEVMGYHIAPKTQVLINAWAIGRDPSLWEDPEEFKPERFLDTPIDYKGVHFELIPFGAGRRGCPGINFATTVIELALANVVHKFDLALPGGARGEDLDMTETSGIAVHKKLPLMVVATLHSGSP